MLYKKFKPVLDGILKACHGLDYKTLHNALGSRHDGLPQNRRKLMIVAIKANAINHEFKWLEQQRAASANQALGKGRDCTRRDRAFQSGSLALCA